MKSVTENIFPVIGTCLSKENLRNISRSLGAIPVSHPVNEGIQPC